MTVNRKRQARKRSKNKKRDRLLKLAEESVRFVKRNNRVYAMGEWQKASWDLDGSLGNAATGLSEGLTKSFSAFKKQTDDTVDALVGLASVFVKIKPKLDPEDELTIKKKDDDA